MRCRSRSVIIPGCVHADVSIIQNRTATVDVLIVSYRRELKRRRVHGWYAHQGSSAVSSKEAATGGVAAISPEADGVIWVVIWGL